MKCECCGQDIRQATSDKFNEFWAVYPSKVGRKKCGLLWKRRKLDAIADMIIQSVMARVESDTRWDQGYIPNPLTFLNGDLWDDEISAAVNVIQWPTKNDEWVVLGNKHKIYAASGEGWPQFKDRIMRRVEQ